MMESVLRVDGHGANAGEGAVVFDSTKAPWTIGLIHTVFDPGPTDRNYRRVPDVFGAYLHHIADRSQCRHAPNDDSPDIRMSEMG